MTDERYRCIVADPPWSDRGGGRGKIIRGPQKYYQLLNREQIRDVMRGCDMWRPAERCHLWIWAIAGRLEEAIWLIDQLGFRYTTNFVWTKPHFGLGRYLRAQHELCLLGTKGKPAIMPSRRNIASVLRAPLGKHSQKPDAAYDIFEAVSQGPFLEMFARRGREGWDSFGNQLDASIQTAAPSSSEMMLSLGAAS